MKVPSKLNLEKLQKELMARVERAHTMTQEELMVTLECLGRVQHAILDTAMNEVPQEIYADVIKASTPYTLANPVTGSMSRVVSGHDRRYWECDIVADLATCFVVRTKLHPGRILDAAAAGRIRWEVDHASGYFYGWLISQ